jgi:type I restriction enzyme M protein
MTEGQKKKLWSIANELLKEDQIDYLDIDEHCDDGQDMLGAIKEESLNKLVYFLQPSELFSSIAKRGTHKIEDPDAQDDVVIDSSGNRLKPPSLDGGR